MEYKPIKLTPRENITENIQCDELKITKFDDSFEKETKKLIKKALKRVEQERAKELVLDIVDIYFGRWETYKEYREEKTEMFKRFYEQQDTIPVGLRRFDIIKKYLFDYIKKLSKGETK